MVGPNNLSGVLILVGCYVLFQITQVSNIHGYSSTTESNDCNAFAFFLNQIANEVLTRTEASAD